MSSNRLPFKTEIPTAWEHKISTEIASCISLSSYEESYLCDGLS